MSVESITTKVHIVPFNGIDYANVYNLDDSEIHSIITSAIMEHASFRNTHSLRIDVIVETSYENDEGGYDFGDRVSRSIYMLPTLIRHDGTAEWAVLEPMYDPENQLTLLDEHHLTHKELSHCKHIYPFVKGMLERVEKVLHSTLLGWNEGG